MQLLTACTFGLLVSSNGILARRTYRRQTTDTEVRVQLSSQSTETGSQVGFPEVLSRVYDNPPGGSALFETIEVRVGAGAQQDLRCQAIGMMGKPLVATRGNNTDVTFSDADKGEWTFLVPSAVAEIVCDPGFVAAGADGGQVRVILSNSIEDFAGQTVFDDVSQRAELPPTGGSGPFQTVEISVGQLVNPNLRCQILNQQGQPIIATRGANTDVTFSDAEKGPWRLLRMCSVSKVICDPGFVARPQ